MIKEEYVSWDSAKLLKEAGYPQTADYINVPAKYLANPIRPTQAQAMRWLRDKHKISVEPGVIPFKGQICNVCDVYDFGSLDKFFPIVNKGEFPTYEAAAEAGIQAACKYIIQKQ